ncbi:Uma2 family endonuclease [Sphingomonas aurantiaca]
MNKHAAIVCAEPEPQVRSTPARFTAAEFMRMAEAGAFDDMKIELVDGELERMNPPMSNHSWYQSEVFAALLPIARAAGLFALAETGLRVSETTIRACDVAVVRTRPDTNRLFSAPDIVLAVEIAETTLARDMGPKRTDYARIGIAQYWVVDSARSVVHVFGEPIDGDYAQVRTIRFGEPLDVPGTDGTITID